MRDDLACELREAGYRVVEAPDGPSAEKAIAGGGIDLVLCDVQLPGTDGLSILRQVRASGEPGASLPFVLLTAYSDAGVRLEAEALDVSGMIVKPIDYDDLLALIPTLLT